MKILLIRLSGEHEMKRYCETMFSEENVPLAFLELDGGYFINQPFSVEFHPTEQELGKMQSVSLDEWKLLNALDI